MATQSTTILYLVPKPREKKLERKRKNLIRLGIEQGQAYAWSRTRMGGWAVAQSPILRTTITLSRLRRRGYKSMLDYYLNTQPQIQWTAKYETRTLGGVRGAPWAYSSRPSTRCVLWVGIRPHVTANKMVESTHQSLLIGVGSKQLLWCVVGNHWVWSESRKGLREGSCMDKRDERKRTYRWSDEKTSCCQNLTYIEESGKSIADT
jgi:hypothetical protein